MKKDEKDQIKLMFVEKCQNLGISQNEAAIMAGTKGATVSQVFNSKYAADDSNIYRLLGQWVGYYKLDWQLVETSTYRYITSILEDSRKHSNVYALIGEAGCGKTSTSSYYSNSTKGAIYVQCCEFWNRKQFLREVMAALGREYSGLNITEMMASIVDGLKEGEKVLILDEADKPSDNVFIFFITLYNRLEDLSGIVMMGTPHLAKRIKKGVDLNRKGYSEIWSRLGRKFMIIPVGSKNDIAAISRANGIDDRQQVEEIVNDSAGDFRRTKRLIHKYKLINQNALNL